MRYGNTHHVVPRLGVCLIVALIISIHNPVTIGAVTLDDCIKAALAANPDIQTYSYRIDAAEAQIKKAASAYYPRLTFSYSYTRTNNPPQAFMMQLNQRDLDMRSPSFDPNNPGDIDNIRTSVGFKYRLFDFGSRRLNYVMAKQGKEVSAEQRSAMQNQLIHQVSTYFYSALQARAFVSVQEKSVESLRESLRVATERYHFGTALKTDVLNLEVKLAQAQEDLIKARNGVQLTVAALNTAIGKELVAAEEIRHEGISEDIPVLTGYESDDVENRPELKMTRLNVDIKKDALKKAKREYGPTVNAFGSVDWDGEDLGEYRDSYLVGARLEWNVFTGFYRKNSVAEALADLMVARAELKHVRNQLLLDLKQSYLNTVEAGQRLEVARKSVKSAEESLRITQELYKHKATDITELFTAEVGLTAIRMRAVTAYYDYLKAHSNMGRARGNLVNRYVRSQQQ